MALPTNKPTRQIEHPVAGRWLPNWLLAAGLAVYWCTLLVALHYPWGILRRHHSTYSDKLVHAAIYGGLALLVMEVVQRRRDAGRRASVWLSGGLVVALIALQGAIDEWTQPLTGRTCDLLDWVADIVGAILAIVIYRLIFGRRRMTPIGSTSAA